MTEPSSLATGLFGRRALSRFFFWSLTGDLVSKLGVLAVTLIAARSLGPLEFGEFVGLFAVVAVAAGIWEAGVSQLLTRELAGLRVGVRNGMRESLWIRLRTFPVLVAILAAGFLIVVRGGDVPVPALIAFAVASVLLGLHALPLAALRGFLAFRDAAAFYAAGRWASALVALLTFLPERQDSRLEILAVAVLIGELVTLLLAGLSVHRTGRSEQHAPVGPESSVTFRAALPFATNSLLGLVYNRLDVIILAGLSSQAQLALYAPASRIQDALYLIPASISVVALPVISSAWGQPDGEVFVRHFLRRLLIGAAAVTLPITIAFFVLTPQIIDHVLGSSYHGTTTPMRILVWFLPLAALTAPILAALAGTGRAAESTKVFAMAFAVAMILHLSLDWWWGATGAAVASFARDPGAFLLALILAARFGLVGRRVLPRPAHGPADAPH